MMYPIPYALWLQNAYDNPYLTSLQVVDVFTTMATRSAAASLPPTQSPRQRDQSKPHLREEERDTGERGYSVLELLLPQYKYLTKKNCLIWKSYP